MYPRPTGEVYLCGLGNSDYVDPPRLKAGGDCEKPENISPDPLRVTAATKSFKGLTSLGNEPAAVSQVGFPLRRFCSLAGDVFEIVRSRVTRDYLFFFENNVFSSGRGRCIPS